LLKGDCGNPFLSKKTKVTKIKYKKEKKKKRRKKKKRTKVKGFSSMNDDKTK